MSSHFTTLSLPTFTDPRGSLTVLERALPFEVVSSYWIYGADGQTRGGHRHTYTRQALIAMNGTVSIYMNDGVTQETIDLSSPHQCLLVEPKDWHTMTFGPNAILMVLSSHNYDRSEYIDTPYESLSRSNAAFMADLEAAASRVIRSGWYVLGQEVSAFVKEFAAYTGAKHCIGVTNGLDALILSIEALDLPAGPPCQNELLHLPLLV